MPIQVLEPKVIAQIAAGEVVERPASVVKELVENSLDAGATQITIEVSGGVSLIRVTDNGSGIPAAEVALAFEHHATSKIRRLEELSSIRSLGFRGEALPSIAAVAAVEMVTCARGETAGTAINLEDGVITGQRPQARPPGTTVTVRGLFRKVPARLKFLKSAATENSHVAAAVGQYALAYPEVVFSLLIDGKPALRTPGRGRLLDAVIELYGVEIARQMLEIKETEWEGNASPVKVTGLVGAPSLSRSTREYLSFCINRRGVNSRLLGWAVEEAYHGLLMTGRHPVAVLNIALPPAEVDVNIHPAKSEVKFQNERQVFTAVQRAVRQALLAQSPVPRIEEAVAAFPALARSQPERQPALETKSPATFTPETPPALLASLPVLRVLGQLQSSYIVAEGPDGLYLIDQHAAHERVLFEQIKEQQAAGKVAMQGLLEPATFEVTPAQEALWQLYAPILAQSGFNLEPFGQRTYLVRTVPALLHGKDWAAVLRELLDGAALDKSDGTERMFKLMACHGAVRAGQILSDDEMRALVRRLETVALPHTCPHGRPTLLHLTTGRLRREFGRT